MDGAMRFVKGDVIASIIITIVNILGGLAIGVGQRGLDALRRCSATASSPSVTAW
jgi:type III secretory pathway component EscV